MKGLDKIRQADPDLANKIICWGGFLNPDDVKRIEKIDRFLPLLVRCNCGRFTTAAQDALHFAEIINKEGSDWVRDISLIAADEIKTQINLIDPQENKRQRENVAVDLLVDFAKDAGIFDHF